MEKIICPNCKHVLKNKSYFKEEIYCDFCGQVIKEENINFTPEWSSKDNDVKGKTRINKRNNTFNKKLNKNYYSFIEGGNEAQNTEDIFETISKKGEEISNPYLKIQNKKKEEGDKEESKKSLELSLNEIKEICSKLNFPFKIIEKIQKYYIECYNKNFIRGRSIKGIIAACIYLTCKQENFPKTLNQISKLLNINKKDIGRIYRYIKKTFYVENSLPQLVNFFKQFFQINISPEAKRMILFLLKKLEETLEYSGRGPEGIVSTVVYFVCKKLNEEIDIKDIIKIFSTTEIILKLKISSLNEVLEKYLEDY